MVCENGIPDTSNFGNFTVPKIVLPNKIINRTKTKKGQGNSSHRFGDNYLENHLLKFPQNTRLKNLELSREALIINFLNKNH